MNQSDVGDEKMNQNQQKILKTIHKAKQLWEKPKEVWEKVKKTNRLQQDHFVN